jgi:spoIIIJ-associated protein
MKKEITATGKTVEAAVAIGAEQLGVDVAAVTYEVLEAPKKGFLGFGESPAKVKVCYTPTPESTALAFVRTLIADMGIEAEAALSIIPGAKREFLITVSGEEASALIGHHGDTLDSLQYLTNLAANRREEDEESNYTRITVDIENYRAKREDTLRKLARRMADKALRTHRSVTLEPMNAYERRIIHSEIQNISGVTTNSIGTDHNRRVVISLEGGRSSAKPQQTQTPKQPPRTAASRIVPKNKIEKRARFDDTLPEYHLGDSLTEDASIDQAEADNDTDEI